MRCNNPFPQTNIPLTACPTAGVHLHVANRTSCPEARPGEMSGDAAPPERLSPREENSSHMTGATLCWARAPRRVRAATARKRLQRHSHPDGPRLPNRCITREPAVSRDGASHTGPLGSRLKRLSAPGRSRWVDVPPRPEASRRHPDRARRRCHQRDARDVRAPRVPAGPMAHREHTLPEPNET
jgi:hypothetical protein